MTKATFIPLTSSEGRASELGEFLRAGRDLVTQTEPDTPYWFALRDEANGDHLAIFDLFPHEQGRTTHFAGNVAKALQQSAPELVDGGWEHGVVSNVRHYETLAQKVAASSTTITKATAITLRAATGQTGELAQFLTQAAELVRAKEPGTKFWFALQSEKDERDFAIVDFFETAQGREAHFNGEVAAALEANASRLVVGGWTQGVLENIEQFDVVAARY